jgi:hypothetical protein
MLHKTSAHNICLQVYDGYGHTHNLVTFGHVYIGKPAGERKYTTNIFANIRRLIRLFFIKPIPRAKVVLEWQGMTLETLTETDGFFKFEWESPQELAAGWHTGSVRLLGDDGVEIARQAGRVMVPHITQYGFISDIDDTVLVSHSATVLRRMKTLLTKHPHNRHSFAGVQAHYQALSVANTDADVPNPFFYVSSSEWNLFYDLKSFFHFNQLPQGVFLLNQIKRWYQLFGSGQTKHSGKLARIFRVMEAFPKQNLFCSAITPRQIPTSMRPLPKDSRKGSLPSISGIYGHRNLKQPNKNYRSSRNPDLLIRCCLITARMQLSIAGR